MIKWKKRENEELRLCREKQMTAVIAEFESPLLRYAARILNNPVSAEDVVQNVFIKLFKAIICDIAHAILPLFLLSCV